MTLPRIAIVGRPNVGKSSLVNMLASRRVSIVDDTPGTTRDRVTATVTLESEDSSGEPLLVELTDTGGYGVYTVEGRRIDDAGKDLSALTHDIESQIQRAVASADIILFVIDTQAGITAQDREVARLLREGGLGPQRKTKTGANKPGSGAANVVVIANKCDGPRWEPHAFEASAMGFGEPIVVSAENNFRRRELVGRLYEMVKNLKGRKRKGEETPEQAEMKLAIVGKRNAGKSTLVNTLAGEERVIVSEIAGTTRDAVDVRFEMDGKVFIAIDTAGLRKKKSFQDRIEWWAFERCRAAVDRSDVCLLLIDATEPVSQIDQQLGHLVVKSLRPVVIVVNKWDLAEGKPLAGGDKKKPKPLTTADYETYLRGELKGLDFAPISFISAANATNINETIELAFELFEQAHKRVTTGVLNRLLRDIIKHQGPSNKLGTFAKVLYVSQIKTAPPTIVCVVNKPELFTPNYKRFLMNRFREELPFGEVPIDLIIRARARDEVIEQEDGTIALQPREKRSRGALKEGQLLEIESDASSYFDDEPAKPSRPAKSRK